MTRPVLESLFAAVSRDRSLMERWNEARSFDQVVEMASELGLEVDGKDLHAWAEAGASPEHELEENQLDQVSGGSFFDFNRPTLIGLPSWPFPSTFHR